MTALPEDWCAAVLGDLAPNPAYGLTAKANYEARGPKFLRITDIQGGAVNWTLVPRCASEYSERYSIQLRDIVVARTGATTGKSFLIESLPEPALFASYLVRLRPHQEIAEKYIQYFTQTEDYWQQISQAASGIAQPGVNASKLAGLRIPLAPKAEQSRIVTKLDSLFARTKTIRQELDRIPALIARYKQAVLSAAFSGELTVAWRENHDEIAEKFLNSASIRSLNTDDLPALPQGWSWVGAGQLCDIKSGITLGKKRAPETILIEKPYLRVANVQRGWLNLEEIKTLQVTEKEAETLYLQHGDVLMNEGGDRDKLGRGWVWEGQVENCIHQNHVFRLRPRSPRIPSRYISYYSNEFGQSYFLRSGKQTTNLASISLSKVSALPIPVAPPREMERIVQLIETAFGWLDRVAAEHENATRLLPRLDQAILAKAFSGELVPQDPNEEPASKLLERVRTTRADSPKRGPQVRLRGTADIQIVGTGALTVAQKEQDVNKTRKDVPPSHLCDIVKKSGGEIKSADLWRASEMQIDEFYKLLRDDVSAQRLKESKNKASITDAR